MKGETRRNEILKRLSFATAPVSASTMAEEFGVSRQVIVQHLGHSRRKRNPFVLIGNNKWSMSRISNQLKKTTRTITASGYLLGYFLGTLLQKRIIAHSFLHSHSLFFREGLFIIQSVESESHSHTLLIPHDSFVRGHTYHATFFSTGLFQSLR